MFGALWMAWSATPAAALPAYGRAANLACSTCHVGASRLTPFGIAFQLRGDRMLSAHGDSLLRAPSIAPAVVGVAGSGESWPVETPSAGATSERIESIGLQAKVRLGGAASTRLAASADPVNKRWKSDLAYVQLGKSALQMKAGTFDGELPPLSPRLRPTETPNLAPLGAQVTGLGLDARSGSWVGGIGLVDGERHTGGGYGEQVIRGLQDTYVWVAREQAYGLIGARMLFDHQDSTLPSLLWMQHLKFETGASLLAGRITLIPAYVLERFDDRPIAGMHERHQYAVLEALRPLGPRERWIVSARYEHEYRTPNGITRGEDRQLAVANLAYQVAPEAKVAVESSLAHDNVGDPSVRSLDVVVRMSY